MAVNSNMHMWRQIFTRAECSIISGIFNKDIGVLRQQQSISHLSSRQIHGFSSRRRPLLCGTLDYPLSSVDRLRKEVRKSYSTIVHSPYPKLDIPENISLDQYMLNEFAKYGEKIALIDGLTGVEYSYAKLQTMVVKIASSLIKMGIRKGSVVTIFGFNCPEYIIMFLAIGTAGGVASTVNPAYTSEELEKAISHVGASVLVLSPELISTAKVALSRCPAIRNVVVFGAEPGYQSFSSLLDSSDMSMVRDNLNTDSKNDVFVIPFSSGTTGLPKGVMLTHYNLLSNVMQSRGPNVMDYSTDDHRVIAVLPIFHIYGQSVVFLAGLALGVTIVCLPRFDPPVYLRTMQKYKATLLHVVPPLMLFLAKHPMVSKFDFSTVSSMFTGAAPCGVDTINEVSQRLNKNMSIRNGYGLTEASPMTHSNPINGNKPQTCGIAIQNTDFKIVDVDSRKSLGAGQKGELLIRGPQVMKGYYKNVQATADTLVDGWLLTGDIGYHDEDGHLVIVDRMKELIKVKGLQVAPAELEALLVTHPSVLDAAVIGRPDERLGEAPVAFIVLKPNLKPTEDVSKELKQFVAAHVAPYKRLVGGIQFCKEIPKAASGKILRRVLKADLQPLPK